MFGRRDSDLTLQSIKRRGNQMRMSASALLRACLFASLPMSALAQAPVIVEAENASVLGTSSIYRHARWCHVHHGLERHARLQRTPRASRRRSTSRFRPRETTTCTCASWPARMAAMTTASISPASASTTRTGVRSTTPAAVDTRIPPRQSSWKERPARGRRPGRMSGSGFV